MTRAEIQPILDAHREWLTSGGARGKRADLYGADLTGADLYGANLYGADLTGADLTRADLYGANLYGADLTGADLTRADLTGANLTGANLTRADLTRANLTWAYLTRANLTRADLTGADLTGADLTRANLTRADLTGADLTGANLTRADLTRADLTRANLTGADLTGAKNIPNMARLRTQIVPDDGPFRGYKKLADGYVAILDVPESAQRSNATGRKCRVSEAVVRRIYHPDHPEADVQEGRSRHDAAFIYRVGETVRPTELFDENRWNECGSGIHLFITRAEAEAY